jgi:photosystem II stability/assembly factor-like uncharacterized protein
MTTELPARLPAQKMEGTLRALMIGSAVALLTLSLANAARSADAAASAPQFAQSTFGEMRWRLIGPFRGGRTVGLAGIPTQPNVFYIGVNDGGVWKTTDYGQTWQPIFDGQPTGSIGTIAIAPSDPNIIYVGSGEGLRRPDLSTGDGIYKSTDAGKTWVHLGLRDGQQIGSLLVDPTNPDRVFAAVLGHPYGPNEERGVFRSLDGGLTWKKVLYKDENTGAIELEFAPGNPNKIYADQWASRQLPWEIGGSNDGPGSGLYVSSDGGDSWQQLTTGLPTWSQGLGRIGFDIAPTDPNRMYALVDSLDATGVYRSDDAGVSWRRVNTESRITGRGSDFAWVRVAPNNPDQIFVSNTSTYRSDDGGVSFTAIKGAPGGDDYHATWINPLHPEIIALTSDQGATISVNGGATWSSWYNQPTAQFYHVITDNRFPYWVYGGQQESGSVGIASRGNDGQITEREWHPVGAEEYGYIAPDPLDPNIVFGGKLSRFNWTTGQVQDVSPAVSGTTYRVRRTAPVIFSPTNPHALYFAANVLFKTLDSGHSWTVVSPDLSRPHPEKLPVVGPFAPGPLARRGVIYSVALSPVQDGVIWAGTDDGFIWRTADGGNHWSNVTPPGLVSWSKVAQLEGSHFNARTAYAAINRFRSDDLRPYIYRTHDGGKTWRLVVNGLPDNAAANTVREDPIRRGLLYAGTERAVYVSFDDGDRWQPLQLNLPSTSMRDLTVHGDDLVVGTHGRSFWILDDLTPLRQLNAAVVTSPAFLFAPQTAIRIQRDQYSDTPLPPEVPAGQNPPDGAILDYMISDRASGTVTLAIYDAQNRLVRRYSSDEQLSAPTQGLRVPTYWVRQPQQLSAASGMHRFVWDLRYPAPDATSFDYPISAIFHDTPPVPQGPLVLPGSYTVHMTWGGKTYVQRLTVRMDPRVKTSQVGLAAQFALAQSVAAAMRADFDAFKRARDKAGGASSAVANDLDSLNGDLAGLLTAVDGADDWPTKQQQAAFSALERQLAGDEKKLEVQP